MASQVSSSTERAGGPKARKAAASRARRPRDAHAQVPLAEAAERYRALLKALPDLMFVLTRDGTYVDFWADHENELALPAGEILGKNLTDVPFSPKALAEIRRCVAGALRTGKPEVIEYDLATMGGPGHFEAHIVRLDDHHVLSVVRNITHRKENEERLRQTSLNLKIEKQALHDKNIALEQVLAHLERRAQDYHARVTRELEREIRPVMKKIRRQIPKTQGEELARLEERIEAILARDASAFESRYARLSQRELEVCDRLREGLTSKQVAERLHLSAATVHKHREQIRNKLGFQGKRVNLAAYLRLHPSGD